MSSLPIMHTPQSIRERMHNVSCLHCCRKVNGCFRPYACHLRMQRKGVSDG